MALTEEQIKQLSGKLDARHVRAKTVGDRSLLYIEAWHAVAEANRIFGFDGWDRETLSSECIMTSRERNQHACIYLAKVRVRVRANGTLIVRDGTGTGSGQGPTPAEAHDLALKTAETDAMKRALATFGNAFGLALYDRSLKAVRGISKSAGLLAAPGRAKPPIVLHAANGEPLATFTETGEYLKALEAQIGLTFSLEELYALWSENLAQLAAMKAGRRSTKGRSQTAALSPDTLIVTFKRRARELGLYDAAAPVDTTTATPTQSPTTTRTQQQGADGTPSAVAPETSSRRDANDATTTEVEVEVEAGAATGDIPLSMADDGQKASHDGSLALEPSSQPNGIDKSVLMFPETKRLRDRDHLRYVATQPCLVCGRKPAHAHHIRYAQPRAMGRKVSDEFTVPLCYLHHGDLHSSADERKWWRRQGIDPIVIAEQLWRKGRGAVVAEE